MLNRGSELGQGGVVALGGKLGEAPDCPGLGDQQLVSERVGDRSRLLGELPSPLEVAPVRLERGDRGQHEATSSGGLGLVGQRHRLVVPALREIEGTRCGLQLRKVHAKEHSTCLVACLHRPLVLPIQQQARLIELAVLSLPV